MRNQAVLYGAAALCLMAAPAFAQTTISPQSPMATPNSMNTTGPTACASQQDPKSCQDRTVAVPVDPTATDQAPSATTVVTTPAEPSRLYTASSPATVQVVTNGPVPDTPENRARFGGPQSRGGQKTAPVGN